jgi:hypothetical protein
VVLAGDGGELVLVGAAAVLREGLDLREGLLAAADADDHVDLLEESLALVAPVAPLVVDDALVDVEALVLRGLGTGDAGCPPAPDARGAVGQSRDAQVGETRDDPDVGGVGVVGQDGVERLGQQVVRVELTELLAAVADDTDLQGTHRFSPFRLSSSNTDCLLLYNFIVIKSIAALMRPLFCLPKDGKL